jgi:hypothetical protein
MINQIKEKLPDIASHIVPQNTVIKSIKNDYCLRPAFNFGVDNMFSNLRNLESDAVFTLQIFKGHESNTDLETLASQIKHLIYNLPGTTIDREYLLN